MLRLFLALALQQPSVAVQIDRDEVPVGADIILTIIVTASGSDAVVISEPDLRGLELIDRREQTRVSMEGGIARRVTTRQLTLRAVVTGSGGIGVVRVRHSGGVAETEPLGVTVLPSAQRSGEAVSPRIRELVSRVGPPNLRPDDATVTLVRSNDSIHPGEQVDIVVVAWFPRSLRARLRNPPTLEAPTVQGGWVYTRPAPTDVTLSRFVRGQWYDLYVLHQIVFPLTAGNLEIGEASVSYSVPLSSSFLSRELRREDRSAPSSVAVAALPALPSRRTFNGAAGQDLEVRLETSATELQQGDAALVRVELRGRGNVSLWPEPALRWPAALRAYRQDVNVDITFDGGQVGGSKSYEYLVVADSAGRHQLPASTYLYFDSAKRRYVDTSVPGVTFVAAGNTMVQDPLRPTLPLMALSRWRGLDSVAATTPMWLWLAITVLPPLLTLLVRARPGLSREWAKPRKVDNARAGLPALEGSFARTLADLIPTASAMAGEDLAAALRAAGVEASLAAHASRVRDRLHQLRYGPQNTTDADELIAEVRAVLQALPQQVRKDRSGAVAVGLIILMTMIAGGSAPAQTPERLYEAGAVRVAADSFTARAALEPHVAAHWFNLGNAHDRLGDPARARAAWVRAERLAPRNDRVRRAVAGVASPDQVSDRLTWVSSITVGEAAAAAVLLWVIGWALMIGRVRVRFASLALAAAVVAAGYAAVVELRYRQPTLIVLQSGTPLRDAPYGSATAVEELEVAAAVRVERAWGPWRLVSHGDRTGWLLLTEAVGL
jgi:hypothetical protein